jgi:hypothetical protein
VVGFKAVPSGDVGTNAWSEARSKQIEELKDKGVEEAEAKALASGRYTFYQVCCGCEPVMYMWRTTPVAEEAVSSDALRQSDDAAGPSLS